MSTPSSSGLRATIGAAIATIAIVAGSVTAGAGSPVIGIVDSCAGTTHSPTPGATPFGDPFSIWFQGISLDRTQFPFDDPQVLAISDHIGQDGASTTVAPLSPEGVTILPFPLYFYDDMNVTDAWVLPGTTVVNEGDDYAAIGEEFGIAIDVSGLPTVTITDDEPECTADDLIVAAPPTTTTTTTTIPATTTTAAPTTTAVTTTVATTAAPTTAVATTAVATTIGTGGGGGGTSPFPFIFIGIGILIAGGGIYLSTRERPGCDYGVKLVTSVDKNGDPDYASARYLKKPNPKATEVVGDYFVLVHTTRIIQTEPKEDAKRTQARVIFTDNLAPLDDYYGAILTGIADFVTGEENALFGAFKQHFVSRSRRHFAWGADVSNSAFVREQTLDEGEEWNADFGEESKDPNVTRRKDVEPYEIETHLREETHVRVTFRPNPTATCKITKDDHRFEASGKSQLVVGHTTKCSECANSIFEKSGECGHDASITSAFDVRVRSTDDVASYEVDAAKNLSTKATGGKMEMAAAGPSASINLGGEFDPTGTGIGKINASAATFGVTSKASQNHNLDKHGVYRGRKKTERHRELEFYLTADTELYHHVKLITDTEKEDEDYSFLGKAEADVDHRLRIKGWADDDATGCNCHPEVEVVIGHPIVHPHSKKKPGRPTNNDPQPKQAPELSPTVGADGVVKIGDTLISLWARRAELGKPGVWLDAASAADEGRPTPPTAPDPGGASGDGGGGKGGKPENDDSDDPLKWFRDQLSDGPKRAGVHPDDHTVGERLNRRLSDNWTTDGD